VIKFANIKPEQRRAFHKALTDVLVLRMVALLRSSISSCAREVGRRYAGSRARDQATLGRHDRPRFIPVSHG
jgi:hypothetical protein